MTAKQKKARDSYLRRKYGITLEDYATLFKGQKGKCAICGNKPKKQSLHVDHDHKSGRVRGLLCFRCNYGFGFFRYDRAIYAGLVSYVQQCVQRMKGGK